LPECEPCSEPLFLDDLVSDLSKNRPKPVIITPPKPHFQPMIGLSDG
jgi:hypothetical protein